MSGNDAFLSGEWQKWKLSCGISLRQSGDGFAVHSLIGAGD